MKIDSTLFQSFFSSYEHIFLLSDNRHLSFFVWRHLFRKFHVIRYLLVPGYMFAYFILFTDDSRKSSRWKSIENIGPWLVYFVCVALSIVPSPLFEFRYYILPFLIFRLILHRQSTTQRFPILLELGLYVVINIVIFWVFLYRPFRWAHDPENLQRIMW